MRTVGRTFLSGRAASPSSCHGQECPCHSQQPERVPACPGTTRQEKGRGISIVGTASEELEVWLSQLPPFARPVDRLLWIDPRKVHERRSGMVVAKGSEVPMDSRPLELHPDFK